MARRLMVILMSALILAGSVSCDLSDIMGAMSKNAAGANPGKIDKVNETISTIWSEDGSGGYDTVTGDSEISIGNIMLPSEVSSGVTAMLSPLDDDDLNSLTSAIAKAATDDSGRTALKNSLSEALDPEDEKDNDKKVATQGSATIIKNMIENITGAYERTAVTAQLQSPDTDGMPKEMKTLFLNLIDGIYDISEGKNADGDSVDITVGDMVIMQTLYTVIGNISDTIFDESVSVGNEMPPMRDFSEMSTSELNGLIDQLNAGLQVIDAVAPASKFNGVQISDILSDLMGSMENEEGSAS